MSSQSDAELAETYSRVVLSFGLGMLRFWEAEAAGSRLACALLAFRSEPRSEIADKTHQETLHHLGKIRLESFDGFAYVMNVSHLVYATTLLDTFLSDTTLFLLLRHPGAIGPKKQIALDAVLGASSVHAVIAASATQKTREVSYLSFPDRLNYLRETFGLGFAFEGEAVDALAHYPSVRNAAVHDQGVFEITLNDTGSLVSRQKTCARHPSRVTGDDVTKAAHCYDAVAESIARAVLG